MTSDSVIHVAECFLCDGFPLSSLVTTAASVTASPIESIKTENNLFFYLQRKEKITLVEEKEKSGISFFRFVDFSAFSSYYCNGSQRSVVLLFYNLVVLY